MARSLIQPDLRFSKAVPIATPTIPIAMRTRQGVAISAQEKSRQMAPSTERIPHLTGLITLRFCMKLGMNMTGIMPPPIIDMTILMAQPIPLTDCSVLPRTAIDIMIPTKQIATQIAATANFGKLNGRKPSIKPSINNRQMTPMVVNPQARALPAKI